MFRQRLQGRFHFQQSSSHPQVVVERKMLLLKYPKTSQQGECGGKKKHCIHWSMESVRLQETWKVARKVVHPAFVPRNSSNSSFLGFVGDQCRSTWSKWPPNYELILKTDSHTLILYQHLTIKIPSIYCKFKTMAVWYVYRLEPSWN